jgi:hypothetical protein
MRTLHITIYGDKYLLGAKTPEGRFVSVLGDGLAVVQQLWAEPEPKSLTSYDTNGFSCP